MTPEQRIDRLESILHALLSFLQSHAEMLREVLEEDFPPPKVRSGGRARSGAARMSSMTPEERSAMARSGAEARWGKKS